MNDLAIQSAEGQPPAAAAGGEGAAATKSEAIRIAMVTNEPAPYRVVPYSLLAALPNVTFKAYYFTRREPTRTWDLPPMNYEHVYLKGLHVGPDYSPIHLNLGIWRELHRFAPDVIVTTGYNPSHLMAYAYARLRRIPHVAMTDGTAMSEQNLSSLHRLVRRNVFAHSAAFVGACRGSFELLQSYGVPAELCFQSHLCANNDAFFAHTSTHKPYDFIFSGRYSERKNPLFALRVVEAVSAKIGRSASIAFIGTGELEGDMRAMASQRRIDAHFLGFAKQSELPARYSSAKVFLFPTMWDPWGVVANEACAAGLPVLVTPVAGVANELIVDEWNGYVMPLDVDRWATAGARLLGDAAHYRAMSENALSMVKTYSYANAAAGILQAARAAVASRPTRRGV
jgi:glycosyltransferase involved in cell wall biosynthesis